MILIAAADRNWAIGHGNRLLVSIPADMKRFASFTRGNTVVMGRRTLESFPGGKPLPDRVNIVLTGQKDYDAHGAVTVHSEQELWQTLSSTDPDRIFVIGGGTVYRQLLPYCHTALITRVDYAYEADTFMPDLDREPGWYLDTRSEEQTCFDLIYYYDTYRNRNVKPLPSGAK